MTIAELGGRELRHHLRQGLNLRTGPFVVQVHSNDHHFARDFQLLYAEHPCLEAPAVVDAALRIRTPNNLRRWIRPKVHVHSSADRLPPFAPFPRTQGFALFEWALNWTIAVTTHQYLLLHSAVLARDNLALLLPGTPGAGKSTLCAALMHRGWRVLSDEFGLLAPDSGLLHPFPRPIPLKNASIEVIRRFAPNAIIGPTYPKTRKGDVAHLRPSSASVSASDQLARPRWVVYPQYQAGTSTTLEPYSRGRSFLKLTGNAFNYRLLGRTGFHAAIALAQQTDSYALHYSDLNDAIDRLETTLPELAPAAA